MDNPKFIFDFIEKLNSLGLSTYTYLLIVLMTFLASLVGGYLGGYLKEKSKIDVITNNFELLKEQLRQNTETTKRIETSFNEKLWISQQVWQKKFETYEKIFEGLAKIKDWTDHTIGVAELHLIPHYIASNYQPYFTKEEDNQFYQDLQQATDHLHSVLDDPEHEQLSKAKSSMRKKGIDSLSEILVIKSFILDSRVAEELRKLNTELDESPLDHEGIDEFQYRLSEAMGNALKTIKSLAQEELKL